MISIHGWRSDQYGLLQTPVRRVARRMGSRGCGVARSVLSQSVPSVGEAEVSPQGFSEERTGRSACDLFTLEGLPPPGLRCCFL